jgi:hypothetical protein
MGPQRSGCGRRGSPEGGKFSGITGTEKSFAHGDKPDPARSAACRITLSDIVAHLVDAEKFS